MRFIAMISILWLGAFGTLSASNVNMPSEELEKIIEVNFKVQNFVAKQMVKFVESKYGKDLKGRLGISSVLIAHFRPNITIGYDFLQDIRFDAYLAKEEGGYLRVRNAIEGKFANHGIHIEVISGRKMMFLLPSKTRLVDLDGINLNIGQSSTSVYNFIMSVLGISWPIEAVFSIETGVLTGRSGTDTPFYMHYLSFNIGLAPFNFMSFPTLQTNVNWSMIEDQNARSLVEDL